MSSEERNKVLMQVADRVADFQHHTPDDATLCELTASAAAFVPGAQFAGITVVHPRRGIETAAATHDYVKLLDDLQRKHNEGPCLTAGWHNHVVRIDDLASDPRWPLYRDDALNLTSIRSVLSLRLFGDSRSAGALNLYAEPTHVFDDESVELGLVFATHIALVWSMVRRGEQFRSALASRDIIGQAKGMLMERFDIDALHAFELIKRLSQHSNTPVAEIARQLIYADHPPQ